MSRVSCPEKRPDCTNGWRSPPCRNQNPQLCAQKRSENTRYMCLTWNMPWHIKKPIGTNERYNVWFKIHRARYSQLFPETHGLSMAHLPFKTKCNGRLWWSMTPIKLFDSFKTSCPTNVIHVNCKVHAGVKSYNIQPTMISIKHPCQEPKWGLPTRASRFQIASHPQCSSWQCPVALGTLTMSILQMFPASSSSRLRSPAAKWQIQNHAMRSWHIPC